MKYYILKLTEDEYKALRYIIAKGWSTQFDANYLKVFEKIYSVQGEEIKIKIKRGTK